MNLAALDLGSNSFHLLVARASGAGCLTKLGSDKAVLRLGAVVERHHRLPPAVFEQALEAVGQLAAVARSFRVERLVTVATSALRDAENGPEFCRAARRRHRVAVELLSGREEGELVYRGARSAFAGSAQRIAVVDIGGGSVEVAVGDGERCELVESLPLGFLRLAAQVDGERGPARVSAVRERALAGSRDVAARVRKLVPDAWVFSGGTARAFGKLLMAGPSGVTASTVRRVAGEVGRSRPEQLAKLGVDEARVDTLGLGATVLAALVEQFGIDTLHVSAGGLREGLLRRELAKKRVRPGQLVSAPAWGSAAC